MNSPSSCSLLMLESLPNSDRHAVGANPADRVCAEQDIFRRSGGLRGRPAKPRRDSEQEQQKQAADGSVRHRASPAKTVCFRYQTYASGRALPRSNCGEVVEALSWRPGALPPSVALLRRDGLRRQSPNASNQPTPANDRVPDIRSGLNGGCAMTGQNGHTERGRAASLQCAGTFEKLPSTMVVLSMCGRRGRRRIHS